MRPRNTCSLLPLARWPGRPLRALLPLARWRERGPGGEGGVRANPSAQTIYAPQSPSTRADNRSDTIQRKSSRCAVLPLTPRPSPRPGARGARELDCPLPDPGRGEQDS